MKGKWVLGGFLLLGCGALESLDLSVLKGKRPASISVFSEYENSQCRLEAALKTSHVACATLQKMATGKHPACYGENTPLRGFFPHKPNKPIYLCPKGGERDLSEGFRGRERLRFFVMGDIGKGEDSLRGYGQEKVSQLLSFLCHEGEKCDFGLVTGDLIYPKGVSSVFDGKLEVFFEDMYKDLSQFPFYLVAGNHDHLGNIKAALEYSYFSEMWRFPSLYYKVPFLPSWLSIFALDTSSFISGESHYLSEVEQFQAARRALCGKEGFRVAFGHHPPDSSGKHKGNVEIKSFLTRLHKECSLDSYFAGHEHHQEHLRVDGYDVFVQGAGGTKIRSVVHKLEPHRQRFALAAHGFMIVDASKDEMVVRFYSADAFGYRDGEFAKRPSLKDFFYRCRLVRGGEDGCLSF